MASGDRLDEWATPGPGEDVPPPDSPLSESGPAPVPPPRGRPGLAWVVIAGLIAWTAYLQNLPEPPGEEEAEESRVQRLLFEFQGKYIAGASSLLDGAPAPLLEQAQDLAGGSVRQRSAAIVLSGELEGPGAALKELASLEELLARLDAPVTGEEEHLLAVLDELYTEYASGRLAAPAVDAGERQLLRTELGWFGRLALHPDGGPEPKEREDLIAGARRAALAAAGAIGAFLVLALLGLGGLLALLAAFSAGRAVSRIGPARGHGGIYAETFAVWLALFLLISIVAGAFAEAGGALAEGAGALAFQGAAFLLSLAGALAWPVWRGVPWPRVRRDIGWTAGRSPLLEPLLGPAAYVMALPLLVAGFVAYLFLLLGQGGLGGAPEDIDSLEPIRGPSHPIIEPLLEAGWGEIAGVVLLVCVVAPLVEETMFRGVLYRHLRDATHRWGGPASAALSVLVSSFLFAAIHPQGILFVPVLMGLAAGFSIAREWRGTIVPSVIAHGISNGITLALFFLFLRGGA